jgi:predicted nucleic acid-binding protein
VLIYAADRDGDPRKHEAAIDILRGLAAVGRGLLPLQALSEFYAVAIRKSRIESADAAAFMDVLAEMFPVREAVLADVRDAVRVHHAHGIPFWDGMLWSVTRRAGARYLLSEDFQDGRDLEGIRFVDPFAASNAELVARLIAGEPSK